METWYDYFNEYMELFNLPYVLKHRENYIYDLWIFDIHQNQVDRIIDKTVPVCICIYKQVGVWDFPIVDQQKYLDEKAKGDQK